MNVLTRDAATGLVTEVALATSSGGILLEVAADTVFTAPADYVTHVPFIQRVVGIRRIDGILRVGG